MTDAASHVTQYGYNTENDVTSITDASNHQTTIGMLEPHIPHYSSFPSGYMEYYNFDAFGNLSHINDRKGNDTYFWADFQDRQVHKSTGDGNTFYTYDAASRLTQVQDGTGTYTFAYDGLGRLKTATTNYAFLTARNFTVSYTYDKASNRVTMTDPEGTVTSYGYDTLNRLTSLGNSWAGTFDFGYDALSRRTNLTRPNGVNTSYSYDNLSRLLSVAHQNGSTTLDGASYTYDAAGNRLSKTDLYANVTSAYAYDNIYQLTGVTQGTSTTESYTYDAVGNRLSSLGVSPYSYNTSNELTSTPSGSYTYDHNGNMLTRPDGAQFSWDYSNRLTKVVLPGTGGTITFKYDPFGRRIQKSGPSGTVNYVYDGANLIEEVDSSGISLARYAQGGIDEPLSEVRSGTTSYYEQDGGDSTVSLSNSAGTLANTYTYDSYGKETASSGSIANAVQYAGREFDAETGLYFDRARYYDTSVGRFVSEDPTRFNGGIDFYPYVLNNPLNLRDPSGESATAVAGGIGTVICFESGVCETVIVVGVGVVIVVEVGYLINNWYESRSRGNSDPIAYPEKINPGHCDKEPGKCKPCPPPSPFWDQPGNAHGGTTGVHYHWYVWNQEPYPDCTCHPRRMDGGTPPAGGNPWSPGGAPWP